MSTSSSAAPHSPVRVETRTVAESRTARREETVIHIGAHFCAVLCGRGNVTVYADPSITIKKKGGNPFSRDPLSIVTGEECGVIVRGVRILLDRNNVAQVCTYGRTEVNRLPSANRPWLGPAEITRAAAIQKVRAARG